MGVGSVRDVWSRSPAVRLGIAAAAMLLVAEGAALLLSPSDLPPPPPDLDPSGLFTVDELRRADDFRSGQRLLALGGLASQALVIGALAVGRPAFARRRLQRLGGRRVLGTAVAGAIVVTAAELASFPTSLIAHERAVDAGLSTQSLGGWLSDLGLSLAITAAIAAPAVAVLAMLVRRFPRGWWAPGAIAVVAFGAITSLLTPVLIAPAFNDFEPLPKGSELRAAVIGLGERADVEIGEVYSVDSSRRSSTLNAYVAGIGPTKRVVLYDTLVSDAERAELESVVAHELAHVANSDIPRGLAFLAIVGPLGLLFVRELANGLSRRASFEPGAPGSVPALLLSLSVAAFLVNIPANQLSRAVERSADRFALELTGEPDALIDLQTRLARTNLSDPDPPAWSRILFGTHPTTLERIGSARAYEAGRR